MLKINKESYHQNITLVFGFIQLDICYLDLTLIFKINKEKLYLGNGWSSHGMIINPSGINDFAKNIQLAFSQTMLQRIQTKWRYVLFINNIHQQKAITRKSYKSNIQRNKGLFLGIPHILQEKQWLNIPWCMINSIAYTIHHLKWIG